MRTYLATLRPGNSSREHSQRGPRPRGASLAHGIVFTLFLLAGPAIAPVEAGQITYTWVNTQLNTLTGSFSVMDSAQTAGSIASGAADTEITALSFTTPDATYTANGLPTQYSLPISEDNAAPTAPFPTGGLFLTSTDGNFGLNISFDADDPNTKNAMSFESWYETTPPTGRGSSITSEGYGYWQVEGATQTPEPSTLVLALMGATGIIGYRLASTWPARRRPATAGHRPPCSKEAARAV